jgi:hypothetical protein
MSYHYQIEARQKIVNDVINTSTSKQMFSFGKAKRFGRRYSQDFKTEKFYDIPSSRSHRMTSFGYGKKYDIITMTEGTGDNIKYNKAPYYTFYNSKDSKHYTSPKYSFGSRNYNLNPMRNTTPGPGKYITSRKLGYGAPKYSFRKKLENEINKSLYEYIPGPGKYRLIEMSNKGKYPLSNYENTKQVGWSLSKTPKFFTVGKDNFPGAGKYEIKDLMKGDGKQINSKYKGGTAYSMGLKFKSIFDLKVNDKYPSPGPGQYDTFSEFTMFKTEKNDGGSLTQRSWKSKTQY